MAKVMIVDDNPDIRQALELQLRSANYTTVWAEDTVGTLEVCDAEGPDLILLDLGLVGGDGFMVMERLRQLHGETPIIVLSARDPELNEAHALRCGASAFMQKPYQKSELLATIRQLLLD